MYHALPSFSLPGHANTQREVVGHLSLRTSTAPSCISEGGNKPLRKIKSTHPIPVKDSEIRPGKSLDLMYYIFALPVATTS